MPVNPNEAPEGFVAVAAGDLATCDGCAFNKPLPHDACAKHKCMGWERDDSFSVIFVPRANNKPATANFPHDDMGTPV